MNPGQYDCGLDQVLALDAKWFLQVVSQISWRDLCNHWSLQTSLRRLQFVKHARHPQFGGQLP